MTALAGGDEAACERACISRQAVSSIGSRRSLQALVVPAVLLSPFHSTERATFINRSRKPGLGS
jgi:hypothetical protein